MEEPQAIPPGEIVDPALCISCRNKPYQEGYATKLCADCRSIFVKYPFPRWIMAVAIGVSIVMVIGLVRMPKYITASVNLSRGEKAVEQRNYLTASKYLRRVLDVLPNSVDANLNMLICSAYQLDLIALGASYEAVADEKIEDAALFDNVESALKSVQDIIPMDTNIHSEIEMAANDSVNGLIQLSQKNSNEYQDLDFGSQLLIANSMYENKQYTQCDQLLGSVLNHKPDFISALHLMAATKRTLFKLEEALTYCERLLVINHEDIAAIGQEAKIEIKRKNLGAAMKYANEAMSIDPDNVYALEAKALAIFYNHQPLEESKKYLALIIKSETETDSTRTVSTRVANAINGIEAYP